MKRRLTLAILGTAAAALLLAGVGTLLLARIGARQSAEEELRNQAESTANLVDLSQTRSAALSADDTEAMRKIVCRGGRRHRRRRDVERLRASVCAANADAAIDATKRQLCAGAVNPADPTLTAEMRAALTSFCRAPTTEALDTLRAAYCRTADERGTPGTVASTAGRRRTEVVRQNLCRLVTNRTESRKSLQTALSKERIELVVFNGEDQMVEGELPGTVTPADLGVEALRAGESVSGVVGDGAWAIAPVDPSTPTMSAILISRPSDPVRGIVPWFLLASGVTLLIGLGSPRPSAGPPRPLTEAKTVTAQIAHGDLSVRVPEVAARAAHDELDELAHSINEMAEALERSRGLERQFLLSVSHDLRTPLTSIRGYAEAIADGATDDPRAAAGIIMAESRRLERLVKDLLDLAKLDARRFTFHVTPVDLREVASDSVDGFRREVESLGLTIALHDSAGPLVVSTDPDRLQQVVANLIENALKFADSTITVSVGLGDGRLEVADDGPASPRRPAPRVRAALRRRGDTAAQGDRLGSRTGHRRDDRGHGGAASRP
jgi:two-component system sensor histidine kinase BaeS